MDAIVLTEHDKERLRVLLREQAKVEYRRSERRRLRASAKHFFPELKRAEGRTA